jgi:hypothetical protein
MFLVTVIVMRRISTCDAVALRLFVVRTAMVRLEKEL